VWLNAVIHDGTRRIPTLPTFRGPRLAAPLFALLLATLLPGCSALPFGGEREEPETTEQILYRMARSSLRSGAYEEAIDRFRMLESRFPFGEYAEQAQLEIIYAHYRAYDPDAARSAADRFIRLHPQHPDVDYAWYLKGVAAFERDRGAFDAIIPMDRSKRDIGGAREAFVDFQQLLARYPDSEYAADARMRMVHIRNLMAASELEVGRFYFSRGAYVAAANRARYVIENLASTPLVADALALMIQSYLMLDLREPAHDALEVLATNYPDHETLDEAGNFVYFPAIANRERSWTNIISFGLLGDPPEPPTLVLEVDGAAGVSPGAGG
jgi:outer membrane protein assembly factor BamD